MYVLPIFSLCPSSLCLSHQSTTSRRQSRSGPVLDPNVGPARFRFRSCFDLDPGPALDLDPGPFDLDPGPTLDLDPGPALDLDPGPTLGLDPGPALDFNSDLDLNPDFDPSQSRFWFCY
ncbi:hypothetical protein EVAR_68729_1 [Eumeta japonica]|uniref:Uncharacterized protein n=1 Tax=Eumeta variegata TaxID=151549 RepID=A0A4C2A0I7_EUMVA|nr:hypothetical protein EVAR_68729_1 [Eumeta japonica]